MDIDYKESINQIVELHEHGTECEINKSLSALQSLGIPLTRDVLCCFFDILSNRMVETCKKIQIAYISSMENVEVVERPQESSSNESNILISVTSTPQCDSKNNSDLLAIHSEESTEVDTHSSASDLDVTPMEQDNVAVNDAPEVQKELVVAESSDCRDTESMKNDTESPTEGTGSDALPSNDMNVSPAKPIDATPVTDNDSEVASNKDQLLDNVDVPTVQLPTIDTQEKSEVRNSMDFDDDALQSGGNAEEIAKTAENSANMDEDFSPVMSPAVSPGHSSTVTPNVTPDSSPARVFESPAPTEKLDDPIESKSTEESQSIAPTSSIELELVPKLPSDENLTAASCSSDSEEQSLMGFYEADTIQATNQLKRKEITEETKPACSLAKKSKPSEEVQNDVQSDPTKDLKPASNELSPTKDAARGIAAVPKNNDPNIHCQNATYQTRCMICNQFDPRIVKHYQIMHPDCDFFISRSAPHTIERMLNKSGCKILKDGKITAYCAFCDKTEMMPEMEWRHHLLAHTGELEFYCTECCSHLPKKMQHGGCAIDKTVNIFDQGADGEIMMFMCKWCNYIQVHKSRIIRHLTHEHGTGIDTNFSRNIEKVTFIPNLRPLTWRMSSHYELVKETDRFRCSFRNCAVTKGFSNFAGLEQHLNDYHNDESTFKCPHCHEAIENTRNHQDIQKHLKLHGRYLAECNVCNKQFDGNWTILSHMVRCHPTESIQYRCTYIESNNDIDKRENAVWLQCNVCGVRKASPTEALDHCLMEHKSPHIECSAIKMIKRTNNDGLTSCFTIDEKQMYTMRRGLVCSLCDRPLKSKLEMLEHFNRGHQNQEIMLKFDRLWFSKYNSYPDHDFDFTDNFVFYCNHCRDGDANTHVELNECHVYNSIDDVHDHWQRSHTKLPDSKPFRFYAVELVLCVHCKFIGSFEAVKQHSKQMHSNGMLTISKILNPKACTLCPFVGDKLGQHIKIEHQLITRNKTVNPTRFTDDLLSRLNHFVLSKYRCSHCNGIFETEALAQRHSTLEHLDEPFAYEKWTDDRVKLIAGCCESQLELHEFLDHFADPNHLNVASECSKCGFRTNDTFEYFTHQVEAHRLYKDPDLIYKRMLLVKFWATKVIFGNGLVVTKHNLLGTEWDDLTPFKSLIERLLAVVRERLIMIKAEKNGLN